MRRFSETVTTLIVAIAACARVASAGPRQEHGHGPVRAPATPGTSTLAPGANDGDGARIDWARGLVIAGGIGVADRHAPSPAVARGTARRGAEDVARAVLAAKLRSLPLAAGGTLADRLADPATKAKLDRAVADAITLDAEPETDGAWHVVLAVPIEAVRLAITPSPGDVRAWPAAGDSGPPIVIVDGAAAARPAVGWTIVVAGAPLAAPIVWSATPPASAAHAPHVKAKSAKAGTIELGDAAGATAATLFVITSPPAAAPASR